MFAARRVRQGLLTATLLAIGVVPPAGAATQIGETFTPAPDSCFQPDHLPAVAPAASLLHRSLAQGVITAWSHEASVPTDANQVQGRGIEDLATAFRSWRESQLKTPVPGTLNNLRGHPN